MNVVLRTCIITLAACFPRRRSPARAIVLTLALLRQRKMSVNLGGPSMYQSIEYDVSKASYFNNSVNAVKSRQASLSSVCAPVDRAPRPRVPSSQRRHVQASLLPAMAEPSEGERHPAFHACHLSSLRALKLKPPFLAIAATRRACACAWSRGACEAWGVLGAWLRMQKLTKMPGGARASLRQLRQFIDVGVKPDAHAWKFPASTVNAWYDNGGNALYIPAGMMQKPFFSSSYPAAQNFGAIGSVSPGEGFRCGCQ